jgi:hypothetical protein
VWALHHSWLFLVLASAWSRLYSISLLVHLRATWYDDSAYLQWTLGLPARPRGDGSGIAVPIASAMDFGYDYSVKTVRFPESLVWVPILSVSARRALTHRRGLLCRCTAGASRRAPGLHSRASRQARSRGRAAVNQTCRELSCQGCSRARLQGQRRRCPRSRRRRDRCIWGTMMTSHAGRRAYDV